MAKTYLNLNQAAAIQYADLIGGDLRISAVIPDSPATGDSRRWGFYALSKECGAYFEITGATFQAKVTDGINGTSETAAITWDDDWTNTEVVYRIRWEPGLVTFYVGGVKKAVIALEDSGVVLSNNPLSVYVQNATTDEMLIGNIDVIGVGSYLLQPVTAA